MILVIPAAAASEKARHAAGAKPLFRIFRFSSALSQARAGQIS
jgi:hypothetical protein